MRGLLAALGLVLLAGCATAPPAPVREAPIAYPPVVRDRILRIAEAEWVEWGRITLGPGLPRPPAGAEGAVDAFPRVLAYWRAVPEGEAEAAVARNRALWAAAPGTAAGVWSEPAWSAAFVSYVMRSAGVDTREFTPSAAHSFYLDAILRDARDFPDRAPFLPRDLSEHAPAPGDLVCADRSRTPLGTWRDRLAEAGRFRPMHCDIVLRTAPGVVEAVGGNVADAVTLTRYPADEAGRLLPRGPGEPVLFAVMENRLGRLFPFGGMTMRIP
ncbi:DUF2272 domain-containing protein [Muricoccus radiodurans]|uniref:DUF2272 domain-containing protein n=1 Tax=Muricoccus radiodurans TaxID=2231721 RepID=UPI003CFA478F